MHKSFRLTVLCAIFAVTSAWAGPPPVVATLDCFGAKVEMRSTCIVESAPYTECSSQVLRIADKTIQLRTKANEDLSAGEWACEDNKRILVLMSNGANCEQCEKVVAFDKTGHRVAPSTKVSKSKPLAWKDIPILSRR